MAEYIENGVFKVAESNNDSVSSMDTINSIENKNDDCSISSSLILIWPDPLPKQDSVLIPKFSDFEYIGRLGDGASGQVYCAQHIQSKEYVAVKVIDGLNEQARHQLEVEKQILYRYSDGNPYMIKAYCTFHQGVGRIDIYVLIINQFFLLD
jgi:hypothetical protein